MHITVSHTVISGLAVFGGETTSLSLITVGPESTWAPVLAHATSGDTTGVGAASEICSRFSGSDTSGRRWPTTMLIQQIKLVYKKDPPGITSMRRG